MNRRQKEAFALRSYALHKIDEAPFAWCHVRTIMVGAVGFFADAYDLFAVNFVNILLGHVYFSDQGGVLPPNVDLSTKMAGSVGTVMGQLGFGLLNDIYGRRKMYGLELIVMIVAVLGLTLSTSGQSVGIVGLSMFWRIILGIGIGGDYPNSSVLVSEFSTVRWRGAMIGSVFAAQGLGAASASVAGLLCVTGFKRYLQVSECDVNCQLALDKSWRIIYGLGIVPAIIALWFRLTIPETIRYTLDISRDEPNAVRDAIDFMSRQRPIDPATALPRIRVHVSGGFEAPPKASFRDFKRYFGLWKNGKVLLGTAGSWFLLDIAFYGISLNLSPILDIIGFSPDNNTTVFEGLRNLGIGNIILSISGLIGYWFTVGLVDTLGRKTIQIGGFIILTILFSIIGFCWSLLSAGGLVTLYCLSNFFTNFGPNTTTFILPGEVFPTRYRSTGHGISAAAGKIGAILSQALIGPLRNHGGPDRFLSHVMQIFALFMFLGIFTTLLIPETKGKTLEELTGELSYIPMPQSMRDDPLIRCHSTFHIPSYDELDSNDDSDAM